MTAKTYDLIVIGAGPAGYWGAARMAETGRKTLLIEKEALGGVCLNEGCIPSKTLLNSAKIYDKARNSRKYGVAADNVTYDHGHVIKRKNKVVKNLVAGIRAKLKKSGVELAEGPGRILGKDAGGYSVEAGNQRYTGKQILIASGSKPLIPPIPGLKKGLKSGFVLTSREILDLPQIPPTLAVIGGGYIGLEMASYFNSAGSKVTVIEMLDHVAGEIDRDVSKILLKKYREKGVEFQLNSKVTKVRENSVTCEKDGEEIEIQTDKLLLSAGRAPVTEELGLETVGVESKEGYVKVDSCGKTDQPGIYAAGDVNGRSMLAHTAFREADVCINNMLGQKDLMRYGAIPEVIYTTPEIATVGHTEVTAREKGIDSQSITLPMMYSGRHVAEDEDRHSMTRILVEKETRRLLGVHMIGRYVSEIIYGAAMMVENEMRVKDVRELVFPHPTVSEIIREGVFQL